MPRLTWVVCEVCKTELKVGEKDSSPKVFEILQVIDATGESFWFDKIACLRVWADKYVSPYVEVEPPQEIPPEAMLPTELN
jgi:hypothetical protein